MFRYEMHLHTSPVSLCAIKSVRETLTFYKKLNYDGVFITNHFLDGNINVDHSLPYEEKVRYYFSDFEDGVKIGKELGLRVFCGVELSYFGTDFLVFGLEKDWWLSHSEIMGMKKSEQLPFMIEHGAFIAQAHPFRTARWIDHVRLYSCVQAIEIFNGGISDIENEMADLYATKYGKYKLAGTDNHVGELAKHLFGIETETPISDVPDFISKVKNGETRIFSASNPLLKQSDL